MGVDLQTLMTRRGPKVFGAILLLASIGFFVNLYLNETYTSNFRRALFYNNNNNNNMNLENSVTNQFSWSDGKGKK